MSIFLENEIEYPFTVTVTRPGLVFDEDGNYEETSETVVENMTADIQMSLKVRKVLNEDETGVSDATVWIMFSKPPAALREGDRVADGVRTFVIDAVGDWGSHTECVMRKV